MRVYFVLIGVALCVISFGRSASSSIPKNPFNGISPEDLSYYKASSDSIKCKDGSKKFRKSRLNDDFCDCPDGTDEPGTSACPTGKFYCPNIGHISQTVFSSRVNDDCCDGSDEYDGTVKCRNTCWEAGKATRDKLKKKIATYQEGAVLRKKEVEQARIAYAKDEAELKKLKPEEKKLKGLVQQLKERKEQIEELEDKLRLQKEKEEEEKGEAQVETGEDDQIIDSEDKSTDSTHEDIVGNIDDDPSSEDLNVINDDKETAKVESRDYFEPEGSPHDGTEEVEKYEDDSEAVPEINDKPESGEEPHDVNEMSNDVSENTEELSREELGRLVASRWTGDKHDGEKDDSHEMPKQTHDENDDGYASDADADAPKYDAPGKYDEDDDMDETYEEDGSSYKSEADDDIDLLDAYSTSLSNPSWLEKIQQSLRKIMQPLNLFQTPVNISDAVRVRKEYDEFSNKLSKIESRISTLSEKLKHDFGSEKEFYSFYDLCFESKQNKYVYKVCPYNQASQEEGYTATRLGNWEKFEDSYRAMIFSNGDKCWNGPYRSLKVRLRCGLSNEITDVDEPSRCEYVALLSTPAVCTEDKLKELQSKLDLLNKQQPEKHDEL